MLLGRRLAGERIADRYILDEFLGEGGFGVVYAAREQMGDDYVGHVAVKLCPPPDPEARRQLVREVQAMSQLAHPSLVGYRLCGVIPGGPLEGVFYIVMELCARSLRDDLTELGSVPPEALAQCLGSVAEGVAHMHRSGAVHRDIKPENVLLASGKWKLGDMGLARAVESGLTTASRQIGTLAYMSPEMVDGHIGPASDVYAMGIVALECLTGRLPYDDMATSRVMRQILTSGPTIPPGLPAPWDSLVPRLVALDPAQRPSAEEVARTLLGMPTLPSARPAAARPAVAPASSQVTDAAAVAEARFAAACDMALVDGVIVAEEKASLKALAESLGLDAQASNRLFAEAVRRRAERPLTATGQRQAALGEAQRSEACRAIAELYGITERRVRNTLDRVRWDVDLAMARLEEETERDRRGFALMEVSRRAVVPEPRARAALEAVGWDLEAALQYISADDESVREAARQAAAERAAERREKALRVAKIAGGAAAGAAAVVVVVAGAAFLLDD